MVGGENIPTFYDTTYLYDLDNPGLGFQPKARLPRKTCEKFDGFLMWSPNFYLSAVGPTGCNYYKSTVTGKEFVFSMGGTSTNEYIWLYSEIVRQAKFTYIMDTYGISKPNF